jgi:DNA-binding protein H-NS
MLALVSRPVREFLLSAASDRFAQVAQQMRAYAAKREAIRRDLITADEEDAALRAVVHLAGAEECCLL